MAEPADLERLYLIRAGLKRMARELRVLKQQVAREIDSVAAATDDSPEEGHTHDTNRRDAD